VIGAIGSVLIGTAFLLAALFGKDGSLDEAVEDLCAQLEREGCKTWRERVDKGEVIVASKHGEAVTRYVVRKIDGDIRIEDARDSP
jgi:hypothetical protein